MTIPRFALLYLLFLICFVMGSAAIAAALPTVAASEPGLVAPGTGLLIIALVNVVVIAALILNSRWRGWTVAIALALSYYGAVTFLTQIETWYFLSSLTVSRGLLARLFVMGLPPAFLFVPIAVRVLGRWRRDGEAPHPAGAATSAAGWSWRIAVLALAYVVLYWTAGYFIAWQNPELRAFYGQPGEALPFVTHTTNVLRSDPGLFAFQFVRGVLWVLCALPVILGSRAGLWPTAILVAALFSLPQNIGQILANPLMPIASVRMSHMIETASSNFVFGLFVGWMLFPGGTMISRRHLGHATRFGAMLAIVASTSVMSTMAQDARLTITPATVLIDERIRVTLEGLKPGQDVTIRVDGNRGQWKSSANFKSDERGRIEVPDPMALIWSATGERRPAGAPLSMQTWTFTAEVDGHAIATQTVTRRAVAENVRTVPVRERGLVGTAYFPPGSEPRPAMIVLPGSQGGIPGPASHAGGLASRRYVVLALAYFNAEGLPPLLQNIPLEYFATAVDWLKAQPSVDANRIGVMGTSRGGELALLLGATYPSLFRVVVANVPSDVVWPGLSDDAEVPAWTLNGKPVPGMRGRFSQADLVLSGRERFLKRMSDKAAVERARIPVERIAAPLLMFSGKDDQLWPSDLFAARAVERLKAHKFTYPLEHYSYDNAGHQMMRPFVVTSDVREVRVHPISKRPNTMGGTPEGQARADEDAWGKLLAFLDKYLRS